MTNNVKSRGRAYAVQCTTTARTAGLVDDNRSPVYFAHTYQIAIDDLVLAFDVEQIPVDHRDDIIKASITDIGSVGAAGYAHMQSEGGGYQLNLCRDVVEDAGLKVGKSTSYRGRVGNRSANEDDVEKTVSKLHMLVIWQNGCNNHPHVSEILELRAAQVES